MLEDTFASKTAHVSWNTQYRNEKIATYQQGLLGQTTPIVAPQKPIRYVEVSASAVRAWMYGYLRNICDHTHLEDPGFNFLIKDTGC